MRAERASLPGDAAQPLSVCLALQGGGSHGAFTWGVLDRLLEEPGIAVTAASGASAGAVNAALVADGWTRDGARGARERLEAFWWAVGRAGLVGGLMAASIEAMLGFWGGEGMPLAAFFGAGKGAGPSHPLGINPLRDILSSHVDPARLARSPVRLFVGATRVRDGALHLFRDGAGGIDALMASACLPHLFRAVEIGGEAYWDGGFSGNPPVWPLLREATGDVVLVSVLPGHRVGIPTAASAVADRVDEIAFGAALEAEMRGIAQVRRALREAGAVGPEAEGWLSRRFHRVADDAAMAALPPASRGTAAPGFLEGLRRTGRAAAERWLARNAGFSGKDACPDFDIDAAYG